MNILDKKDFDEKLEFIKNEFKKIKDVSLFCVFGSFVTEEFSPKHSDLDLLLLVNKDIPKKNLLEYEEKFYKIINSKNIEVPCHLTILYKNDFSNNSLLIYNVLKESNVLYKRDNMFFLTFDNLDMEILYLIKFDMKSLTTSNKSLVKNALTKSKKFKDLVLNYSSNFLIVKKKSLILLKNYFKKYGIKFSIEKEFIYRERKDYDNY